MRDLIQHIKEADVFKPASKKEIKKRLSGLHRYKVTVECNFEYAEPIIAEDDYTAEELAREAFSIEDVDFIIEEID